MVCLARQLILVLKVRRKFGGVAKPSGSKLWASQDVSELMAYWPKWHRLPSIYIPVKCMELSQHIIQDLLGLLTQPEWWQNIMKS